MPKGYWIRGRGAGWFRKLLNLTSGDENAFVPEPLRPGEAIGGDLYVPASVQPVLVVNSLQETGDVFPDEDQRIDVQPFNPVGPDNTPVPLVVRDVSPGGYQAPARAFEIYVYGNVFSTTIAAGATKKITSQLLDLPKRTQVRDYGMFVAGSIMVFRDATTTNPLLLQRPGGGTADDTAVEVAAIARLHQPIRRTSATQAWWVHDPIAIYGNVSSQIDSYPVSQEGHQLAAVGKGNFTATTKPPGTPVKLSPAEWANSPTYYPQLGIDVEVHNLADNEITAVNLSVQVALTVEVWGTAGSTVIPNSTQYPFVVEPDITVFP